jgi:prevent-host-death family protein
MTVALPLSEAARTLQALVREARVTNHETILTENGEEVAVIVPIPPKRSHEERVQHIAETMKWWEENTTNEEREDFARDLEAAHEIYNQPVRFTSWD